MKCCALPKRLDMPSVVFPSPWLYLNHFSSLHKIAAGWLALSIGALVWFLTHITQGTVSDLYLASLYSLLQLLYLRPALPRSRQLLTRSPRLWTRHQRNLAPLIGVKQKKQIPNPVTSAPPFPGPTTRPPSSKVLSADDINLTELLGKLGLR